MKDQTLINVSPITALLLRELRFRMPGQPTADHLIAMLASVAQVAAVISKQEPEGWTEDLGPKLRVALKHLAEVIEADNPAEVFERQLDEARTLKAAQQAGAMPPGQSKH